MAGRVPSVWYVARVAGCCRVGGLCTSASGRRELERCCCSLQRCKDAVTMDGCSDVVMLHGCLMDRWELLQCMEAKATMFGEKG
jgi:hypothetical protein